MKKLPFWKAILMTLAIITFALGYMKGTSYIGLESPWIAFLALAVWGAIGMKMEKAPGIFVGGAAGLLISFSVTAFPDMFGGMAVLIPLAAIVLSISFAIKGLFPLIFNYGFFIFMTLGSADIVNDQKLHLSYLPDLAFGALIFWIIPRTFLKLRSRTREKANAGLAA